MVSFLFFRALVKIIHKEKKMNIERLRKRLVAQTNEGRKYLKYDTVLTLLERYIEDEEGLKLLDNVFDIANEISEFNRQHTDSLESYA